MTTTTNAKFNQWSWLIVPTLLFLAIFFIFPLYDILQRSFTDPTLGFGNFIKFYQSQVFFRVLMNTLRMSFQVMLFCLLIGYPYAYLMNSSHPRAAALLLIAVLIPFWSSILVRTYAWTAAQTIPQPIRHRHRHDPHLAPFHGPAHLRGHAADRQGLSDGC